MEDNKAKSRILKAPTLFIAGIIIIFLSAVLLLWHGNATSRQSVPEMVAEVYFENGIAVKVELRKGYIGG